MNAGQIIDLAREWVETQYGQTPGFCGAHLMGSLSRMARDAPFPAFGDVDLNIISRDVQTQDTRDLSYKGLILEYGLWPLADYASPEIVLANPGLAPNIAVRSSLADPFGILDQLQQVVSRDYARRQWVEARCQWEKAAILGDIDGMVQSSSAYEAAPRLGFVGVNLAGLLTVAQLKPPTHRRSLVLMHDLLQPYHRLDLLERTLSLLGYDRMDKTEVEAYLRQAATAFDKAIEVKKTPFGLDFKLQAHIKPYFVDGSQQMIDEGHHREAMWWIAACYFVAMMAILNDGSAADKQHFLPGFEALMARSGLSSAESRQACARQARELADEVFQLADSWVAENPAIID